MNIDDIRNSLSPNTALFFEKLLDVADGVMLTGSHATGRCNSISDIDIVIFSRHVNYLYTESLYDNALNIQLTFLPYYKIQPLIINDITNGQGMYYVMFREGSVLKDDTFKTLTRIKDYVMAENYAYENEQENFSLISRITKCLKVVKDGASDAERYFCASEILLDISRLIFHKYNFDGKHLARLAQDNKVGIDLIAAFQRIIGANETEGFVSVVSEAIDKFGGLQDKYTTGWVYTYPASDNMTILFPTQSFTNQFVREYILKIQKIAKGCDVHAFYVGKSQWMEEGVYVYLFSETVSFFNLLSNLNSFMEAAAHKHSIQCTFPYKTLFHTGVLFGGKTILKKLVPHFHSIWNAYCKLVTRNPRNIGKVSKILATLLLIELRPKLADLQSSSKTFFHDLCDTLLLEAVDPNGLYNIFQMKAAKIATLKCYAESYDKNVSNYQNLILAINQNSTVGICRLKEFINQLLKIIQTFEDNEIILPNIYIGENKRVILLRNICNHVMSIFQLSPTEKYGVVYNYSRYIQDHVI